MIRHTSSRQKSASSWGHESARNQNLITVIRTFLAPEPKSPKSEGLAARSDMLTRRPGRRRSLIPGNQLIRLCAPLIIAATTVLSSRLGKKLCSDLKRLVAFGLTRAAASWSGEPAALL